MIAQVGEKNVFFVFDQGCGVHFYVDDVDVSFLSGHSV